MPVIRQLVFFSLALVTLGLSVTSAKGDQVVFNNLGPGQTWQQSTAAAVTGTDFAGGQVIANQFTSTGNFVFTNAQLPMGWHAGTNILQLILMTNSGGVPGTILETITLTNAVSVTTSIVVANSLVHPLLSSGVSYWLVAYAPVHDTSMGWYSSLSDMSNGSNHASNNSHSLSVWTVAPAFGVREAFQIQGNPVPESVPEPTALLLLGTGLAGIALEVRKWSKARS